MDPHTIPPPQSTGTSQPATFATLTEMEARIAALESDLQKQARTLRTILILSTVSCIFGLLRFFYPIPPGVSPPNQQPLSATTNQEPRTKNVL